MAVKQGRLAAITCNIDKGEKLGARELPKPLDPIRCGIRFAFRHNTDALIDLIDVSDLFHKGLSGLFPRRFPPTLFLGCVLAHGLHAHSYPNLA